MRAQRLSISPNVWRNSHSARRESACAHLCSWTDKQAVKRVHSDNLLVASAGTLERTPRLRGRCTIAGQNPSAEGFCETRRVERRMLGQVGTKPDDAGGTR